MVVLGAVEVLTIGRVQFIVVLGALDIEVSNPTELPINVPLLREFCIIWHPGSLDFVLIVWIKLSLWMVHDVILVPEVFAKVLLKKEDTKRINDNSIYV